MIRSCKQAFSGKYFCLPAVVFLSAFLFSACKKDKKGDDYKVKYTVTATGKFKNGNPKVTYNNASGSSATEEVSIGKAWVKELNVFQSYPIKAAVSGTFDSGEVVLSVEGYKNGNLVAIGESSQSSTSEQSISVTYESNFE
ncbi:MAG: hypothetical protein JNL13_12315 [Chitinophagaceae bacterium]|nr:hypothetical protein [Chitinophagaceae bacterium]